MTRHTKGYKLYKVNGDQYNAPLTLLYTIVNGVTIQSCTSLYAFLFLVHKNKPQKEFQHSYKICQGLKRLFKRINTNKDGLIYWHEN